MLDLNDIREAATAEVELVHPRTREPLGATITIAGPEHPARKRMVHDRQRRLRAKFAKTQKFSFADPADEEADEVEFLAGCTLGWRGIVKAGVEIAFSAQEAARLYADPELAWLRAQVRAGLDDLELFIRTSAPGS
jgi:hypothetical protein